MNKIFFATALFVSFLLNINQLKAQKLNKEKYEKGLTYQAVDSSFAIKFGIRMQNLLVVVAPENKPVESRAKIRRFRLKFDGWLLSPRVVYKMEIGQSKLDVGSGDNLLLDAVIKYNAVEHLWIWFGQTKLPGNRERVVSSQSLETVDRSIVNAYFNIDRDMGLQLRHSINLGNTVIREIASISSGEGRNYSVINAGGYDYTGRIEVLPFGKFTNKGDYFLADLLHEQKPKLAFGATYDFNDRAINNRGNRGVRLDFNRSLSSVMIDMIFKYKGFSAFSEFIKKTTDDPFGTKEKALDPTIKGSFYTGSGFNGQVGYVTKKHWGAVTRFSNVTPDVETNLLAQNQYTLALSKYIAKHKFKIQMDGSYTDYFGRKPNSFMWRFQVEVGL